MKKLVYLRQSFTSSQAWHLASTAGQQPVCTGPNSWYVLPPSSVLDHTSLEGMASGVLAATQAGLEQFATVEQTICHKITNSSFSGKHAGKSKGSTWAIAPCQ